MKRILAFFALFLLAFAADAAEGFVLAREALVTPRGPIAWNEVIGLRFYQRAAQKHLTDRVRAKVSAFAADRVKLDCFGEESNAYVPVEIVLDKTYLRVRVEAGDIVEPLGCNYRVTALEILPRLLDARTTDAGSYLLPLYGGSVVSLAQSERVKSVDHIYTYQPEWEKFGLVNAYGLSAPTGSILAILHGGEFRAQVETSFDPAKGTARQVGVIGIRDDPADCVEHETKEALFRFLPQAKDYAGMAVAYGAYYRTERGLRPLVERMADNPALAQVMTSLRFNIFMGMKRPFRTDGSGDYFSSTTFAEAAEIVDAARAAGIDRAWVCLVGWIKDGHDGAYPSHFPVNAQAGGEAALKDLLAKIRGYGWPVTPHDNIHSLYNASADFDAAAASYTRAGEIQPMGVWAGGMTNLACPQVWLARYGGDFERIAALGFGGVYYIDALGTAMFRCHHPLHPADERAFALGQMKVLGWARAKFGASATEVPTAYALKYIDYGGNGASGRRLWFSGLLDEKNESLGDTWRLHPRAVPFQSVAMHGLVAYQGNWIHDFRRQPGGTVGLYVDGGVPAMEVCAHPGAIGDDYRESLKTVAEPYRVYYRLVPDLATGVATDFEEYAPDAVHWTYDNGLEVFVNATEAESAGLRPLSVRILRNGKEIYVK